MSEVSSYAMLKNNSITVENVIQSDGTFKLDGYYFIPYDRDKVYCQPGMYYDTESQLFYDDSAFTTIGGQSQ